MSKKSILDDLFEGKIREENDKFLTKKTSSINKIAFQEEEKFNEIPYEYQNYDFEDEKEPNSNEFLSKNEATTSKGNNFIEIPPEVPMQERIKRRQKIENLVGILTLVKMGYHGFHIFSKKKPVTDIPLVVATFLLKTYWRKLIKSLNGDPASFPILNAGIDSVLEEFQIFVQNELERENKTLELIPIIQEVLTDIEERDKEGFDFDQIEKFLSSLMNKKI